MFCNLSKFRNYVQDQAQNDAQDNAGGEGKIESEVLAPDDKVAREFPEERYLSEQEQKYADNNEYGAEEDKELCNTGHNSFLTITFDFLRREANLVRLLDCSRLKILIPLIQEIEK